MTAQDLIELRTFFRVLEHIPGYLKLKFSYSVLGHPAAAGIKEMAAGRSNPELVQAKLHPFSRTIELGYNAEYFNPVEIEEFFETDDENRLEELAAHVASLFGVEVELEG